jgi:chorismate-pyruvate lyase
VLETHSPQPLTPDLSTLIRLFYDSTPLLGRFERVERAAMPAAYAALLAHDEHMTVTVEHYHDSAVDVQVLDRRVSPSHYARKILLARQSDGRVVQYGIMRVNLDYLDPPVRRQIEAEDTPLGRVLIKNNVLRRVHLASLWRVTAGAELALLFEISEGDITYGRTAMIECNDEPAVELLEIVTAVKNEE